MGGQQREERVDADLEARSSKSKDFNLLDLNSKLFSKREISRWVCHRRRIRWALGSMLVVFFLFLFSLLTEMSAAPPKLPEDLHELPPEKWRAAGLGDPFDVQWPRPEARRPQAAPDLLRQ